MQTTTVGRASGAISFDFTDRVVVVTGATGGIGSAIALAFAEAGADLVLHGRKEEVLAERAEQIRALGRRAVTASGNMRDPETAARIAAAATEEFGRIDVLVNNAGGNFGARLEELSPNAWNATVETNLSGPFHLAKACLPSLREAGGVVVNIGSASAGYAHPLRGAYAAAKAGLASLTRTMAWEWAEYGIRVNCLEPGAVTTEASRFAGNDTANRATHFVAVGRLGVPSDIAKACLFLSSDGASYITGQTIIASGGVHVASPADIEVLRPAVDIRP